MHLEPRKVDLLKTWIVKNIEARSDADSDVLADYVVALVTSDVAPLPTSKAHYVENLKDFLAANTQSFVDDLFAALYLNSFDPSAPLPRPEVSSYPPGPPNQSRKRSYHNRNSDANTSSWAHSYHDADRPTKHARRSARTMNDYIRAGHAQPSVHRGEGSQLFPLPPLPPTLSGMLPEDTKNAISALLAMQQTMTEMLSGTSTTSASMSFPYMAQRCTDYDTKGFCAAGSSCPYEHGDNPYVIPSSFLEYDPTFAASPVLTPPHVAHIDNVGSTRGRGGNHGRGQRRGNGSFRSRGKRASFSQNGPRRDPSATAVVVEQIPRDRCEEAPVRDFFSDFGPIDEVTVHPERNLAIVRFKSNKSARAAYESPKVIFDNRFVKVHWHTPESSSNYSTMKRGLPDAVANGESFVWEDSSDEDLGDFAKRQEEAQRKYEGTHQRLEEIRKQWEDIDSRLNEIEVERNTVADLIRKKTGQPFVSFLERSKRQDNEQTRALREQLAKLEAEAKSLGIDPEAALTNGYHSHRNHHSRRGYRGGGRSTFGSYRAHSGPSVIRLDNRTKTIALTFPDGDFDSHGEALRQFLLLNSLDPASMEKYSEREDTALLTFRHRYEGEILVDCIARSGIEHLGHVGLAWFKADEAATNGVNGIDEDEHGHEADKGDLQVAADVTEAHVSDDLEDEDLDRIS